MAIHVGDCRDVLATMASESVSAIVTDPPYGISLMGSEWDRPDSAPFSVAMWSEALRVAKPGAQLAAFGSPRFDHRLKIAIDDAGWHIWGTAIWLHGNGKPASSRHLSPAYEPIVLAYKRGPAVLNIEACRTGTVSTLIPRPAGSLGRMNDDSWQPKPGMNGSPNGRWPKDVLIDEWVADDLGHRAAYFYCPKASSSERGVGNFHPTVKPLDLMRWLVRLVAPTDGIVLDPFAGSGTTGVACAHEGRSFVGIELSEDYAEIARNRIAHAHGPLIAGVTA